MSEAFPARPCHRNTPSVFGDKALWATRVLLFPFYMETVAWLNVCKKGVVQASVTFVL